MNYEYISSCISCNTVKSCKRMKLVNNEKENLIYLCKECSDELEEVIKWAEEYHLFLNGAK